jgi:hypothetical protein
MPFLGSLPSLAGYSPMRHCGPVIGDGVGGVVVQPGDEFLLRSFAVIGKSGALFDVPDREEK